MEDNYIIVNWVRHGESCSNFINNEQSDISDIIVPIIKKTKNKGSYSVLSIIGIQQAIQLGIELQNLRYDEIYSSSMIRAILTAMIAFRGTNKVINVVPYLCEQNNTETDINIIKKYVEYMKDWLEYNWFTEFDDFQVLKYVQELVENNIIDDQDKQNLNSIITNNNTLIDSIYKIYTFNRLDFIQQINTLLQSKTNIDQKLKHILNFFNTISDNTRRKKIARGADINFLEMDNFLKDNTLDIIPNYEKFLSLYGMDKKNIVCFTHYIALKNHLNIYLRNPKITDDEKIQLTEPNNTHFFKERINKTKFEDRNIDFTVIPGFIRHFYSSKFKVHDEEYNDNVCYKCNLNDTVYDSIV